jgi:amino acid transporter
MLDSCRYGPLNHRLTPHLSSPGVIVLTASLCYIELAIIMPGVGGDFVYLSRAYGKTASFAFAWYYFWISKPGTQAMVASVFGSYFVTIFTGLENADETSIASKAAAVLLIIFLTILNCFGIMEAVFIVRFFTFIKLSLVATVLVSTVAYLSSHSVRYTRCCLSIHSPVTIVRTSIPPTLSRAQIGSISARH